MNASQRGASEILTQEIPTRGLMRIEKRLLLMYTLVPLALAAYVWVTWIPRSVVLADGLFVGILVSCGMVGLLLASRQATRRVSISPDGATFHLPWAELRPSTALAWNGMWGLVWHRAFHRPGYGTPFIVTLEQGKALVSSPYHAPWDLSPAVLDSLGVARASANVIRTS
jgi:hypothetical protein